MTKRIKLTGKEIMDLATFAGIGVKYELDEDEQESEYWVSTCHPDGLIDEGQPDKRFHFEHVVSIVDYPEEGVMGLGEMTVTEAKAEE